MSRLIDADVLLNDLKLYEKELRNDRKIAVESDDEQMLFAIMNQETAIYRIKRNIFHLPTAYDVDKVVKELEEEYRSLYEARMKLSEKMYMDKAAFDRARILQNKGMSILKAIEIVKGGGVNE